MVSKLPHPHIPYVQVIRNKRELGGIYNNISFVVTFVDVILTYGYVHRFFNMFPSLSFLLYQFPFRRSKLLYALFSMNHIYYMYSAHIWQTSIRENTISVRVFKSLLDE